MLENVSLDQPISVFYVMLHYTMAVMMQVAIFLNGTYNPTTLTDMPVERQRVNVYEFMWSCMFLFLFGPCALWRFRVKIHVINFFAPRRATALRPKACKGGTVGRRER